MGLILTSTNNKKRVIPIKFTLPSGEEIIIRAMLCSKRRNTVTVNIEADRSVEVTKLPAEEIDVAMIKQKHREKRKKEKQDLARVVGSLPSD